MSKLKPVIRTLLPRNPVAHRILGGPVKGARIVTSWHDYPGAILGTTEVDLVRWMASNIHPGETWLDVGAHYGYTALALCKTVGVTGRVFAFEPVLKTVGNLETTRQLNRLSQLTIVPFALGADHPLSLVNTSIERGMATHRKTGDLATQIYVVGLDHVWPSLNGGDSHVDGVKIDVQGMEGETILGMEAVLRESHPKLIIEFHANADRAVIRNALLDFGYKETGQPTRPDSNPPGHYRDDCSYLFV